MLFFWLRTMDPSRAPLETEKEYDPTGQRIVCKWREIPVNLGPDAADYALCVLGPHWERKESVRFGACVACKAAQVDFIETASLKRKYNG